MVFNSLWRKRELLRNLFVAQILQAVELEDFLANLRHGIDKAVQLTLHLFCSIDLQWGGVVALRDALFGKCKLSSSFFFNNIEHYASANAKYLRLDFNLHLFVIKVVP